MRRLIASLLSARCFGGCAAASIALMLFTNLCFASTGADALEFATQTSTGADALEFATQTSTGLDLCMETERILQGFPIKIERHDIIATGNNLPYNIIVTIGGQDEGEASSAEERGYNAVIAFRMEDAVMNAACVKECISSLAALGQKCTVLFSYGDIPPYAGAKTLGGTVSFVLEAADEDTAALCVSWSKNRIVAVANGGGGGTTVAGMLRTICKSLMEEHLAYTVGAGSFGALYRFGVLRSDERVSSFIKGGAAACGVRFCDGTKGESIAKCLTDFVKGASMPRSFFDKGGEHYITFNAFGHFFILGEEYIVAAFILSCFLFTLFICLPHTRAEIKTFRRSVLRLTHILPATLVLTCATLMAGQKIALLGSKAGVSLMMQLCLKISSSFAVITAVYCFVVCRLRPLSAPYLPPKGEEPKPSSAHISIVSNEAEYCYLMSVMSFFNMLLFSAIDISTVFLFASEYVVVLIARRARSLPFILLSCVLLFLPYMPYVIVLSQYARSETLETLIYAPLAQNALYALLFVPHLMQWLRVLSRIFAIKTPTTPTEEAQAKWHFIRSCVITAGGTLLFAACVLAVLELSQRGHKDEWLETETEEKQEMTAVEDGFLKCTVQDASFFGDTLRTIKIETGLKCMEVVTEVKGETSPTVIYCDDFYVTNEGECTDTFRLPPYPPEYITYSFSADNTQNALITVTAIYGTDDGWESGAHRPACQMRKAVIPLTAGLHLGEAK